jgi:drug/metabolite transporter (DMT)-like permease
MAPSSFVTLILCVLAIAGGQILLKMSAATFLSHGLRAGLLSTTLVAALAIYGLATAGWVWQLRTVALSRAYPFMALSFLVVPMLSVFLLGEALEARYWAGTALIVGGILLTLP